MDGGVVDAMLAAAEPGSARIDWDRVEGWLGTALPADYRAIAGRFGSLYVGKWLWVHAPVRLDGYESFDRQLAGTRAQARDACGASGLDAPLFHPRKGGLLPFGSSRGGDALFWDTSAGSPDEWPVVVLAQGGTAYGNARWVHTGLPLRPFLGAAVTRGIGEGRYAIGPYPATAERAYGGARASYWTPPDKAARSDPRRKALKTGSGLAAIQVLVPPSDSTVPALAGDHLPADYRALMAVYGPGVWRDWLRVRHPDELGPDGARDDVEVVAGLRDDDFFPFADSIDGDVLGWVREGEPDQWPIAWIPRQENPGPVVRMTFTQALLRWLRGYPDPVFAARDPDIDVVEQATFTPRA